MAIRGADLVEQVRKWWPDSPVGPALDTILTTLDSQAKKIAALEARVEALEKKPKSKP